jgi:hypothetical protein
MCSFGTNVLHGLWGKVGDRPSTLCPIKNQTFVRTAPRTIDVVPRGTRDGGVAQGCMAAGNIGLWSNTASDQWDWFD